MSSSKAVSFDNRDQYIQLGINVSYYRKLNGMTQEELADKVGISRAHLSAIEAPNLVRAFSLEILFNISTILNVSPAKLLAGIKENNKF